jgi:hypothetical protein
MSCFSDYFENSNSNSNGALQNKIERALKACEEIK